MPLASGQILNNRYRIVKLLGQGGFGAVYYAWDTNLDGPCAIKENFDASPEAQRQFAREASLLFNLRHPNLPKVSDHFSIVGQGQYLVMEYIEGEDLQHKLEAAGGQLQEAQVLKWITQVCDALIYLHSRTPPIIHRDLKPANVRITPEGQVVLVDFGIAKLYDAQLRTTVGARAVTPGYSPMEQYGSGGRTDARTDVYALGATLYSLLTGQVPVEVPDRNLGVGLPPPRTLNPMISERVEAVILQAMEMRPEDRFQNVASFKETLGGAAKNPGEGAIAVIPPATAAAPLRGKQALPWAWIAGAGVAALVLALMLGVFLSGRSGKSEGAATQTNLAHVILLTQSAVPTSPSPSPQPSATNTSTSLPATATTTFTPSPSATELPTRITDGSGVPMALVPAGEFQMGNSADNVLAECRKFRSGCQRSWFEDEEPVHSVYLDAFYIDIYEVTNKLFLEFLKARGNESEGGVTWFEADSPNVHIHQDGDVWQVDAGYVDHPVIEVSWYGARRYCEWRGARLPTEAEWEKAARGGLEAGMYPWGNEAPVCRVGAQNGAKFSECGGETVVVGSYGPNGYGLYDMAGNVWEWASSLFFAYPYVAGDGREDLITSGSRVVRGGSWYWTADLQHVANRSEEGPSGRFNDIGFRCARYP